MAPDEVVVALGGKDAAAERDLAAQPRRVLEQGPGARVRFAHPSWKYAALISAKRFHSSGS